MPRSAAAILALLLPAAVMAQDARRVEVDAAFAVARIDLRSQVLAVPVAPNVTIRSLTKAGPNAGNGIDVDALLSSAQQVGQPRWIGEDIVQVALRLPADAFIERVRSAGLAAGIEKFKLERFAHQWTGRSLQGLGQAIPASHVAAVVTTLRPATWVDVPDDARLDAATRARQNASGTIVDQAAAIPLAQGQTAADEFTSPDGRDRIAAWADTMPATRVVLSDQHELQLSVYLDKQGLDDVLRAQLSSSVTSQSEKMQAITDRVSAMPDLIVGRASVRPIIVAAPRAAIAIHQAPDWAGTALTAEGTAAPAGSLLHTARRAEAAARESLRQKILKLPLPDATTIDQSAKDPAVRDAISHAVDRARVYQTDYNPDGSATIRVSLDGNELVEILATPR